MGLAEIYGAQPAIAPARQGRGLFGDGHAGDIVGGLAKLLTYGPFAGIANHAIHRREDRQDAQDAQETQLREAQIAQINAKQSRNQIVQLPNGGIAAVDPDTNAISMLREPGAPETHDPASVAAFKYMQGLNPEQQKAYRAMLPGFVNTDEGQVQARGMVDYRSAAARATKLAPSYGATHKTGAGVKPPAGFILD